MRLDIENIEKEDEETALNEPARLVEVAKDAEKETAETLNKADAGLDAEELLKAEEIFKEMTALAQEGRQETADALNKADADLDLDAKDNNGRTAVMRAEEHNRTEFMEMLHKAGEQKEAEKSSLLNTLRTLQAQSSEQTSPALEMKNPEKQQAESLLLQQIKNQAGR